MSVAGDLGRAIENDTVKIVVTLVAVYFAYVVLGVLSGFPARGILATLVELTFLISIFAMLSLALNLHWGYTGLFNIGIVGFMAVGAYTTAILVKPAAGESAAALISGLDLPFVVGLAAGVVAAALLGLLVALPALRLRADYLAIVTIAMAEIIRLIFTSSTFQTFTVGGVQLGTGGGRGVLLNFTDPITRYLLDTELFAAIVAAIDRAAGLPGTLKPILDNLVIAVVMLALVAGYYWVLKRTGESPFGRVLKAIREDEDVAMALGKNTSRFKIKSFMLGCGLMGLAGALWVVYGLGQLNPLAFRPEWTFYVWVALIIGGAGSNTGSVLGPAVFVAILFQGPLYLRNVITNQFEITGAPGTIAPAIRALFSLDPLPLVAYTFANMNAFRLITLGVVLVWLMQRRPDGLLGHRKETAATIPLARGRAADGGEDE